MKWNRKTTEFAFEPYISEDNKYRVQDMNDQPIVKEYNELVLHNWDSKEDHKKFLNYCKEHKISLNGANWVLVNNETNEPIQFPFKTAKAAKEYAELLNK